MKNLTENTICLIFNTLFYADQHMTLTWHALDCYQYPTDPLMLMSTKTISQSNLSKPNLLGTSF